MTQLRKVLLVFGLTSAIAATTTFGQEVISFDENGHSGGTFGPLTFGTGPDPINGIVTLFYVLPFDVAPGDVLVTEDATTQQISDLLRFQGRQVWVFSEHEANEPNPDLADVGVPPPSTGATAGPFPESGPEGNNGIAYSPVPGGPGAPSFPITYQFISDVPEPTSFALLGFGSLLALMWRRQARRA